MELIFLGTSSGTPTKIRNVPATAVRMRNSKDWYLIDCGEGTQHQILQTNLSLLRLKAICITHVHGDHCYGLPGILASASLDGRKEKLTIIAPKGIRQFLETVQESTQLDLPFEIEFINVQTLEHGVPVKDFDIRVTELSHRVPSFAFSFTEKNIEATLNKEKLMAEGIMPSPVWGKLQNGDDVILDNGRKLKSEEYLLRNRKPRIVVICGDNDSPELLKTISPKPDVIVHEATFTEEISKKIGRVPQHSSAKKIAEFAEHIQIKNLLLTHFSSRYGPNEECSPSIFDIKKEALIYYSGNLFLANDFDVYNLDKQGHLSLL